MSDMKVIVSTNILPVEIRDIPSIMKGDKGDKGDKGTDGYDGRDGSYVQKAYKTYASMVMDKGNIPTNTNVVVNNDPDKDKNAYYTYDGTEFTKSDFDPQGILTTVDVRLNQAVESASEYFQSQVADTIATAIDNSTVAYTDAIEVTKGLLVAEAKVETKEALNTVIENGGLPAKPFATKALMTASALVDGDYAQVTDDTVNNGLYVKTAGAWVKSEYDPLTQAREYSDATLTTAKTELQEYSDAKTDNAPTSNILELYDSQSALVSFLDSEGELHIPNLSDSVQNSIKNAAKGNTTDTTADILSIRDSNDDIVAVLTQSGVLRVADVQAEGVSLNSLNKFYQEQSKQPNYLEVLDTRANPSQEPLNKIITLADSAEFTGFKGVFAPVITRTGKYTFYLVYEVRETGGDYDDIFLVGRSLTYDPDTIDFTISDYTLIAQNGVNTSGVPYTYLNPVVTFTKSNKLFVHFNLMTNPEITEDRVYEPFYCVSLDGGGSFTQPESLKDKLPMSRFNEVVIFGPGHGIQLKSKEYSGRLVLSAYALPDASDAREFSSIAIYSDDDFETYEAGEYITGDGSVNNLTGFNECQFEELSDGSLVGILRLRGNNAVRHIAYSYDGGLSFTKASVQPDIAGAGTKTALVNCLNEYDHSVEKLVAVCPRSPDASPYSTGRIDAHVWVSYDKGKTFPYMKKLAEGPCQYSEVVSLSTDKVLVIYGGGEHSRGNKAIGHIVNINFLTEK